MVMQSTKAEIGQKKKSEPNCNHHVMSGCSVCVRSTVPVRSCVSAIKEKMVVGMLTALPAVTSISRQKKQTMSLPISISAFIFL